MPERENKSRTEGRPVRRRRSPVAAFFVSFGRALAVILSTVLIVAVFLVAVCAVMTHGPSDAAKRLFVNSMDETSALKFVPRLFLPEDEVQAILHPAHEEPVQDSFRAIGYEPKNGEAEAEPEATPLVQIDETSFTEELEVIDIRKSTFKGKMLIVHDPSRVIVGTLDRWGGSGWYLTEFIERYNAVAGTNAGSFEDPNGMGTGGIPDGLVMKDGQISYGSTGGYYTGVLGFDRDHVLHVGSMTGQDALDLGLVTAVSFHQGRRQADRSGRRRQSPHLRRPAGRRRGADRGHRGPAPGQPGRDL